MNIRAEKIRHTIIARINKATRSVSAARNLLDLAIVFFFEILKKRADHPLWIAQIRWLHSPLTTPNHPVPFRSPELASELTGELTGQFHLRKRCQLSAAANSHPCSALIIVCGSCNEELSRIPLRFPSNNQMNTVLGRDKYISISQTVPMALWNEQSTGIPYPTPLPYLMTAIDGGLRVRVLPNDTSRGREGHCGWRWSTLER